MKISYRIPFYQYGTGLSGIRQISSPDGWRKLIFNQYRQHILDLLKKYGEANDYGYWLNDMQARHAKLYKAAEASGDWLSVAYRNDDVGKYQLDYRGGIGNDKTYKRYGSIEINPNDRYNFNLSGILNAQNNNRYDFFGPSKRLESDRSSSDYLIDNLYSGITDDRRILGRKGDWNDPEELEKWNKELQALGWKMNLDTTDNYYKLERLAPTIEQPVEQPTELLTEQPVRLSVELETNPRAKIPVGHNKYGIDWNKVGKGLLNLLGDPNTLALGRLAGNLINNGRVYDESLKGIKPVLRQTYNTYRQVVGDEATKQAYYRRAAQGQTKAARPFTSDADRQMAYLFEAKRVGDELRALGDLADNQEIRRTSDESNQHQWANALRATEVANTNIASINLANALRHNLLAQKHSALWSSIDNYLKELEYRKRQRLLELLAIEDLIWMLTEQNNLENDPEYIRLTREANKAWEEASKSGRPLDDENVKLKLQELKNYKTKRLILMLLSRPIYKSGGKVTHKKKDDLLYKSTRDVVEHFRKMSKISSDAHNRRTPKIEKLTSHPKGTKKYLLGGVAPFTVYTPVALGGETSRTTSYDGSSNSSRNGSSDKDKEKFDLIKELFKTLQVEGLPSDTNLIYSQINDLLLKEKLFGEEVSTSDILTAYVQLLLKVNLIKYNKALADNVSKIVYDKNAGGELAIDLYGKIAALNSETGLVTYETLETIQKDKKLNPLTNSDLLNLRGYSPINAFDNTILLVVGNATSMTEIAKFLKDYLPKIGTDDVEGSISEKSDIVLGLLILLSSNGSYKFLDRTLQRQAKMALEYIVGILPNNMRNLLTTKAQINGMSPESLISSLINSSIGSKTSRGSSTGSRSGSGSGSRSGGTDTPASVQFLLGNGYSEVVEFNIGNSLSIKALGRFGILLDKEKNNLGLGSNLLDVSKSLFGPILDLDKATFGGTRLTSGGYSHIILNNSDCIGVDLPVKRDVSGNYIPDFLLLSVIEKAEEIIHNNGITSPQEINKIYKELGLPDKFDSNGNIILLNYRRFAGILVILDSKALKGGVPINTNEVSEADDEERELFIEEMKKNGNEDYDLSDGILWSSWGRDKLYKGTIFVPVREDIVAGYTSGGHPLDTDLPNNANLIAMMLHAPKIQQYLRTPPLSSLK